MTSSSNGNHNVLQSSVIGDSVHSLDTSRHFRKQSIAMPNLEKPKNAYWRFNHLWTILLLVIGMAPNWINFVFGCQFGWSIMAVIIVLFDVFYWVGTVLAWPTLYREWRQYKRTKTEFRQILESKVDEQGRLITKTPHQSNSSFAGTTSATNNENGIGKRDEESGTLPPLCHLVIMTAYDEPTELITTTLDTVAAQTRANHIVLVIALESRTPDIMKKTRYFDNRYGQSFFKLILTVHPADIPGEIAGTCSNANWGVRQATTLMRDEGLELDPRTTLLTKFDTDTLFLPTHFELLEQEFLSLSLRRRGSMCSFNLYFATTLA